MKPFGDYAQLLKTSCLAGISEKYRIPFDFLEAGMWGFGRLPGREPDHSLGGSIPRTTPRRGLRGNDYVLAGTVEGEIAQKHPGLRDPAKWRTFQACRSQDVD